LMAMWTAQSGKHMYIEKPGAMSINESYMMADNALRVSHCVAFAYGRNLDVS
jgi:predicted dehydrogenase